MCRGSAQKIETYSGKKLLKNIKKIKSITGPRSKDITEKDIEEDLLENDPSEGFETDIDTQNSSEAQSGSFETIESEKDNPVKKEFEIGELGSKELQEDERERDESGNAAPGHDKPSQRKF